MSLRGEAASATFLRTRKNDDSSEWFSVSVDDVRHNLLGTGYCEDRLKFVKGKVEDTVPGAAPERIAILRLDTDWYESTWHELLHLYPRLAVGGVLIVDEYGHWEGSRKSGRRVLCPDRRACPSESGGLYGQDRGKDGRVRRGEGGMWTG